MQAVFCSRVHSLARCSVVCACTPLGPLALHTPHQRVGKVNAPSNRILTGGGPLRSAARWRFSSSSMRSEMRFASSSAASRSWRSASLFACAASKFRDAAGRNRESKGQKQARGRKRGGGGGDARLVRRGRHGARERVLSARVVVHDHAHAPRAAAHARAPPWLAVGRPRPSVPATTARAPAIHTRARARRRPCSVCTPLRS